MTQEEFMDLLRYYFRKVPDDRRQEILGDYEDHFFDGKAAGKTEEEISRELGSPKAIYDMYKKEGVVEEKNRSALSEGAEKLMSGAEKTCAVLKPHIPGAARALSVTLLNVFSLLCFVMTACLWAGTAVGVYLLSVSWNPFPQLPPLPPVSLVTLAGAAGAGIFAGLAVLFGGIESRRWLKRWSDSPESDAANEGGNDE